MSTKANTRSGTSKDRKKKLLTGAQPTRNEVEQRAVGMAVDAFKARREFEPLQAVQSLQHLGEFNREAYEDLYARLQSTHGASLTHALEEVGLQLWLSCHTCYFHHRLSDSKNWRPSFTDAEESDIQAHCIKVGLADVLWMHCHGHYDPDAIVSSTVRSKWFQLLGAHCLTLADKAAGAGRYGDAFDWLFQGSRAQIYLRGFDHLAEGLALGQPMGRRRVASDAGIKRWQNSDEAKDKMPVRKLWDDWQTARHKYRSVAEFAREAHKSCNYIEDPRTIERWCRDWSNEVEVKEAVEATIKPKGNK